MTYIHFITEFDYNIYLSNIKMGIILKFSFNHKNIATCLFIKKINEPFLLKQPFEKRFCEFYLSTG